MFGALGVVRVTLDQLAETTDMIHVDIVRHYLMVS
jgi:hypothetical protein